MGAQDTLAAIKRYANDAHLLLSERDKAIVKARRQGSTQQEIADAAGLSKQGVAKILVRKV